MEGLLLFTDQNQAITHDDIIKIGEALQHKVETTAEENKQKAIRATEEVVRREERLRFEQELAKATEEWKKERQQIYLEAHHNQLRAIAKETAILEKQLRTEFKDELAKVKDECKREIERMVAKTWKEAGQIKADAITLIRHEEQALAQERAQQVAQEVERERQRERKEAEEAKARALAEQAEVLNTQYHEALAEKEQEMNSSFNLTLTEIQNQHDKEMEKLQNEVKVLSTDNGSLLSRLSETTNSRDSWKEKHDDVKKEFSDFLDSCPGFRGEFILK